MENCKHIKKNNYYKDNPIQLIFNDVSNTVIFPYISRDIFASPLKYSRLDWKYLTLQFCWQNNKNLFHIFLVTNFCLRKRASVRDAATELHMFLRYQSVQAEVAIFRRHLMARQSNVLPHLWA